MSDEVEHGDEKKDNEVSDKTVKSKQKKTKESNEDGKEEDEKEEGDGDHSDDGEEEKEAQEIEDGEVDVVGGSTEKNDKPNGGLRGDSNREKRSVVEIRFTELPLGIFSSTLAEELETELGASVRIKSSKG